MVAIDDPVEFAYIANNYHFIDDAQLITASAGASYKWENTLVSLDGIFGSGQSWLGKSEQAG